MEQKDRERQEHGEAEDRPAAKSPTDSEQKRYEPPRRSHKRAIIIGGLVALLILIAGGGYGAYWYLTGRYYVETDDAYTQADAVSIAPQISGTVRTLAVTDNQRVMKGDLILKIDARTFQAEADQAEADLMTAEANVAHAKAQIELQQAVIAQAEAEVKATQAAVTFAQEELDRYAKLAKSLAGTVRDRQRASADLRQRQADLVKAQAALETERKRQGLLATERTQAEAARDKARAALEQARVNLGYTEIRAPIDGVVGDRQVEAGQYVAPGTKLLSIVPLQAVYVVANYKETQLDRMHRGQPVEVDIDAFPDTPAKGRVDSLAPGSGSQFALLPPENATGNFTKIVQRVPVKILIDADDPLRSRLRPGLSVVVTVDTTDTKGESLQDRPPQDGLPPSPAQTSEVPRE